MQSLPGAADSKGHFLMVYDLLQKENSELETKVRSKYSYLNVQFLICFMRVGQKKITFNNK